MLARSSTILGDPLKLDSGIAYVRDEVMPSLTFLTGCLGLSMLVDRETGQCIATTSWHTAEDMRASAEHLAPMRDHLAEILDGTATVEEWDVASMHRDRATPAGGCCRVTWLRTDHADVDRGIDVFKLGVLPRLEQMDGFCSASLLVDRGRSRACATVSFDSREAMAASREEAWALRDAGVREAGVDVLDAAEFELVLAHLRVPVTA